MHWRVLIEPSPSEWRCWVGPFFIDDHIFFYESFQTTHYFFCSAFGLPEWWKLLYMYIVDAPYRYRHFHGSIIFRYMYRLSTDFISLIDQRNSLDHIISSKNSQRSKDFAFKAYFQRFFLMFLMIYVWRFQPCSITLLLRPSVSPVP